MATPAFEQFAAFVREFHGMSPNIPITPVTKFEEDLGITGDDGTDLLEETEKRFGVKLSSKDHGYRQTFHLGPDEYLFHSEGFDLFGFFRHLLGKDSKDSSVREFTVGELYDAVCRACSQTPGSTG